MDNESVLRLIFNHYDKLLRNEHIYELENIINKLVKHVFPLIQKEEQYFINRILTYVIDIISFKFNFNINSSKDKEKYIKQWTQNKNRDIKACLNLILPFIDDKDDYAKHKTIKSLMEILYNGKTDNKVQYTKNTKGICNMGIDLISYDNTDTHMLYLHIQKFNLTLIQNVILGNFNRLIFTINNVCTKLYINWVNIIPLNEKTYKKTKLYKNTKEFYDVLFDKNKETDKTYIISYKKIINITKNNIIKVVETTDESAESIQKKKDISIKHQYFQQVIDLGNDGLSIGDMYNVIVNNLYISIKPIKWLIFINRTNNKIKYNCQILDDNLPLMDILDNKEWNLLSSERQHMWISAFDLLIHNNNELIKNIFIFMNNNYTKIKDAMKDDNKKNITEWTKVPDLEKHEDKLKYFDKEDIIDRFKTIDLIKLISVVKFEHIYAYLLESFQNFKKTYYGKEIIYNNKINQKYEYVINEKEYEYHVTLKDLYNYSKSIYHLSSSPSNLWNYKFKYYQSMEIIYKIFFFIKITSSDKKTIDKWFKLTGNYTRVYPDKDDYTTYIVNIHEQIKNNIMDIVFKTLITRGVLSEYNNNLDITDESNFIDDDHKKKQRKKLMKKLFKDNIEEFNEAYYYINDKKYKDLEPFRNGYNNKQQTYFDWLSNDLNFYNFYALDWISQIGFFHRYIHKRIMYVTGATGQGKSTQVPKLLLYALKMYEYKDSGRIICTQPRKAPTTNNAERISFELGVPIAEYSNTLKNKVKGNNYTVQYKHQDENNIISTTDLSLRIVTDGTLINEVTQDISMKRSRYDQNNIFEKVYTMDNIYDIIIIDEAHEHNTNMDLLLTMLRNTLYLNNSIKLIIVSATMDDDEPIYRSYYRTINDNFTIPLINRETTGIIKYEENRPKQMIIPDHHLYIDRRFHISPPGMTTQYRISEHYLDKNIIDHNQNITKKDIENVERESIKTIKKICNISSHGEILVFTIGQTEIVRMTKELNLNLPANVIAYPYYSAMHPSWKGKVENLQNLMGNLKVKKSEIHLKCEEEYIDDPNVSSHIYNRAVIIATNVAEASITIINLKYVVDIGYENINQYDIEKDTSKIVIKEISEASRLQRKGRVGRISDGIIYYLYTKDARKENKPQYKITNSDISEEVYKLLHKNYNSILLDDEKYAKIYELELKRIDKSHEETIEETKKDKPNIQKIPYNQIFLPKMLDPNIWGVINKKFFQIINNKTNKYYKNYELLLEPKVIFNNFTLDELNNNDLRFIFDTNYNNIITEQYLYKNKPCKQIIMYPDLYYEFMKENRESVYNVFEGGFPLDTVYDMNYNFYIIHPNENDINRDINNKLKVNKYIDNKNMNMNIQLLYKMHKYLSILEKKSGKIVILKNKLFNTNKQTLMNYKILSNNNNNQSNKLKINNIAIKTFWGKHIDAIKAKTELKSKEIITLIYSHCMDILDEMIGIISLMKVSNDKIDDMALSINGKKQYNNFIQLYKNSRSNIIIYYNVYKKILLDFPFFRTFIKNIEEKKKVIDQKIKYTLSVFNKFMTNYKLSKLGIKIYLNKIQDQTVKIKFKKFIDAYSKNNINNKLILKNILINDNSLHDELDLMIESIIDELNTPNKTSNTSNIYDYPKEIESRELWEILLLSYNKGDLNNEEKLRNIFEQDLYKINLNDEDIKLKVDIWCTKNYLNKDIVMKFIVEYCILKKKIISTNVTDIDDVLEITNLDELKKNELNKLKNIKTNNIEKNIIHCFVSGSPSNLIYHTKNNIYSSFNSDNIGRIKDSSNINQNDVYHYNNIEIDRNLGTMFSNISIIDPTILSELAPMLFNKKIFDKITITKHEKETYTVSQLLLDLHPKQITHNIFLNEDKFPVLFEFLKN
jgi:hypothetical protein